MSFVERLTASSTGWIKHFREQHKILWTWGTRKSTWKITNRMATLYSKYYYLAVFLTSSYFSPKNTVSFLPIGNSFSLLAVRSAQLCTHTGTAWEFVYNAYAGRMQNLLPSCFTSYLYLHKNCFNFLLSTGKRPHHTIQIWFTNLLTVGETSKSHHWCLHPQCSRWLFAPWTTCSQSIHNQELRQLWHYWKAWIVTQKETRHPIYKAEIQFQSLTRESGPCNRSVCYLSKSNTRLMLDSAERVFPPSLLSFMKDMPT